MNRPPQPRGATGQDSGAARRQRAAACRLHTGRAVHHTSPVHRFITLVSGGGLALVAACQPVLVPPTAVDVEPAARIAAAGDHTCALLRNGNLACWGANDHGELGWSVSEGGSEVPRWVPPDATTAAGDDPVALTTSAIHTCVVLTSGQVHCWGADPDDLLGVPNGACGETAIDGTCVAPPSHVALDVPQSQIAAGYIPPPVPTNGATAPPPLPLTCAVGQDGQVRCWGTNAGLALGTLDTLSERPQPDLVFDEDGFPVRDMVEVAIGGDQVYAIDFTGAVWFWGGSVQQGARHADLPRATHLAVGQDHSCLVTAGGGVMCWGNNTNGQAGDLQAALDCDPAASDCTIGPTLVAGVDRVLEVAVGETHSCAVDKDGAVWCWGSNQSLQLGAGGGELVSGPVEVPLPGPAAEVATGRAHTCAVLRAGGVYCWGENNAGQLGVGVGQ